MLLRGPQTPGELRARSGRLHTFGGNEDVMATLDGLIAREPAPLVVRLPRMSGRKDSEYMHLFSGPVDIDAYAESASAAKPSPPSTSGVAELRARVERLEAELAEIREHLGISCDAEG